MAVISNKGGSLLPLLLVTVVAQSGLVSAGCPWDDGKLLKWSDSNTWRNGRVPRKNDEVVIDSRKRVLLDVQPAELNNLTIKAGASLVWGNVEGLELSLEYLLIYGEFHMGANDCRFTKNAHIKLRGRYDSQYEVYNNRKFIAVAEGGTIEIHGKRKTPWTRLAQTIPAIDSVPCALIYDHANSEKNPHNTERRSGMHVIVWNEVGTLFDYATFPPPYGNDFNTFVSSVPNGKVIGMFAFNSLGARADSTNNFKALNDVIINQLGGKLFSSVRTDTDTYSLVTRKGTKSSTVEYYKNKGQEDWEEEDFIRLTDLKEKVDFQVATSAATRAQYFRVLSSEVAFPKLELADDVLNWHEGDKIVVASTDFDWQQAEVREIVRCSDCSKSQIRVSNPFLNPHFGNITYNVDERAEVGLLSRNILIEGVMDDPCYANDRRSRMLCKRFGRDTFGGHVKILRGHAAAHIQGVELYHMGQQYIEGSYPLHFHMCREVRGSWFRDNSIHHSFSRCVTIHGTDNSEVSGNVCYDHLGHGFFLEDSVEQDNVLDGNLGIGTRFGTLLMSDSTRDWCKEDYPQKDFSVNCEELATFWLTHPNNEITNNAAGGGEGHGYMYVFANLPLTKSFKVQQEIGKVKNFSVRHYPIKKFYNNVAHSYKQSGIFMDSLISTGKLKDEDGVPENGIIQSENLYDPRDPPGDKDGVRVWTTMERVTAYRNIQENLWIKAGNVNITFSAVADGLEGLTGGTTGTDTGTSMEYSLFIGRTENKGKPMTYTQTVNTKNGEVTLRHDFDRSFAGNPFKTYTGVSIYQGPMYVKHSYFDQFYMDYWNDSWSAVLGERPVTLSGAVSFKKDSTYPTMTSQYTQNLTFGYCDGEQDSYWLFFGNSSQYDWVDLDGTRAAFNIDKDGSLTGYPGSYIIRNNPFFTGPECLDRPDWGMAVCPYRYIKMEILGKDGNLNATMKEKYPLVVRRDDEPRHPFLLMGDVRREFTLRTHKSYLVDFNTTVEGAQFPSQIHVYGYGVESQDVVRVGVCLPKDTTKITMRSDYPTVIRNDNYTSVNSMKKLDEAKDEQVFYHDTTNGILFFKIFSKLDRTNDSQQCSDGKCWVVKITLENGNRDKIRSCFGASYPKYQDNRPPPSIPRRKRCPGIGSPEGLGAVRWNEIKKVVHKEYRAPCVLHYTFWGRKKVQDLGCVQSSYQQFQNPQELMQSQTRDACSKRCFQKGFTYAGLSWGKTCECSNSADLSADAKNLKGRECDRTCTGNGKEFCGGVNRMNILTTGKS